MITKYFVIFGSFICLFVIVFADLFKEILVPNSSYWDAMKIVPLLYWPISFWVFIPTYPVWYKLTDKTSVGAYISLVGAAVTLLLNFNIDPLYKLYRFCHCYHCGLWHDDGNFLSDGKEVSDSV